MAITGKVKNFGTVAAIVFRATAPTNKKILWYDTSVTTGCPIKYYDLTANAWKLLKDNE